MDAITNMTVSGQNTLSAQAKVSLCDGRTVRLGRKRLLFRGSLGQYFFAITTDNKCKIVPRLGNYYDAAKDTQPPPDVVDYSAKAAAAISRVYLNDTYGDCVIAGKYHQVGIWTGNESGEPVQGTDQEVYQTYQKICGPGDNGCVITDVLDAFKSTGIPLNGQAYKIDGYCAVDWTNKLEVQVALDIFGSLTLGINLPEAWTCTNCTWDVTNTRIVGGHDVCAVGYNATGVQICTWGGKVTITWAAFTSRNWIEELYCELSPNWYDKGNLAPNGIDAASLKNDLNMLANGQIPPLSPPPPPPPPPTPPAPVVSSIAPLQGKAGDTVLIAGRGYTDQSKVFFGSVQSPTVNVVSNTGGTALSAVAPQGITGQTVPITVADVGGTSPVTPACMFTFQGVPPSPPPPPPVKPVVITLTQDQIAAVLQQAEVIHLTPDTSLAEMMASCCDK